MEATLEATRRDTIGKNEARRTRRGGLVPAVLYGATSDGARNATSIAVNPRALLRILHSESGANTLISLQLAGGGDARVLVKDYQLDPVTHEVLHADFYRVAMDKVIQVTIPVIVKGEPKGVKQQGGVLEFIRREIEIECLPGDIPENVEVNVDELMLHQGVRVRELAINPKWKPVSDPDMMLVHVIMPKAEEAPAAADAAAAAPTAPAEPEVIKKGKKEEAEDREVKLIVGLGNPGAKFRGTRHNIGFAVVDELARRRAVDFDAAPVEALVAKIRGAEPVLLAKPLTFMNASGEAVGGLARYFKIEPADLLVVVDEAQLPLGKLRARARGSAGGHNGLKSLIAHLGDQFARLRVGVGRGEMRRDLADHVLARFDADEAAEVERMTTRAADASEMFVTSGIEAVMNAYNGGDPATTE